MTPAHLLSLWRDRWQKPSHTDRSVPLIHGKIARWTMDLAQSNNWGVPNLQWVTYASVVAALCIGVTARLTTNSQIVLAWSLIAFAVYLRRHRGEVVAMTIAVMAALLGFRYFYWRIDATLIPHWSTSLFFGISLLLAELMLWLQAGLSYMTRLWPVSQPVTPLPADAVKWPTVHLCCFAVASTEQEIGRWMAQAQQLQWPENKLHVTLVAGEPSADIMAFCQDHGAEVELLSPVGAKVDFVGIANSVLARSNADLVAFTQCSENLPKDLLRSTVGWFESDAHLCLLHTPTSSLSPTNSIAARSLAHSNSPQIDCAIVRRQEMLAVGGFSSNPDPAGESSAQRLKTAGQFTAQLLVGHDETVAWLRVDEPDAPIALPVRLRIREMKEALDFYSPLAIGTLVVIPAMVIVLGVIPINSDFFTLFAYWFPQWLLGRLALATALEHHRLRWSDFLHEELRGVAVLLRTAKSSSVTLLSRMLAQLMQSVYQAPSEPNRQVIYTPRYELVFGTAFFSMLALYATYSYARLQHLPLISLYTLWAASLALMALASLAVQREMDWVTAISDGNRQLPVLITYSSGTVRGKTVNFPDLPLELNLTNIDHFEHARLTRISIFKGHHEFEIPCRIIHIRGNSVSVDIAPEQNPEYLQLVNAVFARAPNWPQWLPHKNADQLLPGWLMKLLLRLQDAFYNVAVKSAGPALVNRVLGWLKLGNTTNG